MEWIVPKSNHSPENPLFLCVLSNTETAHIPNLSAAGKTASLTDYTPAGDAEIVETGGIISVPIMPMTPPYDTPTPAVITRAALNLTGVPRMFVNAGLKIVPDIPVVNLGAKPGEDIRKPVAVHGAQDIFERACKLGREIHGKTDFLVIGESIPGGTTTAMGVLNALGYDGNVSSSSSLNPLELKEQVVREGMAVSGITFGSLRDDPIRAVTCLGDPMMVTVAGIVAGMEDTEIVLAGGTQMAAVFAIIKHLGLATDNISVATTIYVADDATANFTGLMDTLGMTAYVADPGFEKSHLAGLHRYKAGDVKEGVGAGGAMYLAYLHGVSQENLRLEVERICKQLCG
jgi:uncharacterized protein (TIGR00303 family)